MKAMVVPQWGEKSVLMIRPDPKPSPREAVMKVRAAGVGLTLLNMRTGSFGGEVPRIMGHELAGDIVEVGSDVSELKVGDRCAVYFYLTCGRCRYCRGGRETLCEAFKGHVGVHRDGGSDVARVHPQSGKDVGRLNDHLVHADGVASAPRCWRHRRRHPLPLLRAPVRADAHPHACRAVAS